MSSSPSSSRPQRGAPAERSGPSGAPREVTQSPSPAMRSSRTPADQDLTSLALASRGGDEAAESELLTRVRQIAHRYARARLSSYPGAAETAEDVAQEVCMALITALPRFDDRGAPFEALVYRIASNKVADAHRAYARTPRTVGDDDGGVLDESVESAETAVVDRDEALRAWALLGKLSTRRREIMVLRVAVGLSTQETADALEMTVGAVRVAQHRALRDLRSMWGEGP